MSWSSAERALDWKKFRDPASGSDCLVLEKPKREFLAQATSLYIVKDLCSCRAELWAERRAHRRAQYGPIRWTIQRRMDISTALYAAFPALAGRIDSLEIP